MAAKAHNRLAASAATASVAGEFVNTRLYRNIKGPQDVFMVIDAIC